MDRAMLVSHLTLAERHVADGREHLPSTTVSTALLARRSRSTRERSATVIAIMRSPMNIRSIRDSWVLTHVPAGPHPAPPPAQHYFPTEE
jgi:hypothetical protein